MKKTLSNEGFTLLEVMIVIIIFSVMGVTLTKTFGSALTFYRKIMEKNLQIRELVILDTVLKESFMKVSFPFWEKAVFNISSNILEIPWYKGNRKSLLTLSIEQGVLFVSSDDGTILFKGWSGLDAKMLTNRRGMATGISVLLTPAAVTYGPSSNPGKSKAVDSYRSLDTTTERIAINCVFGAIGSGILK